MPINVKCPDLDSEEAETSPLGLRLSFSRRPLAAE